MNDVNAKDVATAAAKGVVDNAQKLGLTWQTILATVKDGTVPSSVQAVLDGDTEVISVTSTIGPIPAGARVYVITVPPAGNYAVGYAQGSTSLFPAAIMLRSANQSIGSGGVGTAIQFDTEELNNFGMWISTAATDIVIPYNGVYNLFGNVVFAAGATGVRSCVIQVNGVIVAESKAGATNSSDPRSASTSRLLVLGDVVTLVAYHTQGSNLNVTGSLSVLMQR